MSANEAYIALGSNLGDREALLHAAIARIGECELRVTAVSSFYETEPQGFAHQPWFLNAVARCETVLSPVALLRTLRQIEQEFGRVRPERSVPNGPRTLDLDILLFGNTCVDLPELNIPHPRMLERRFVLEPLLEIAPGALLPSGEPIAPYLPLVRDQAIRKPGG